MAREYKVTSQHPIIPLPLVATDEVEVWRGGVQYQAPFEALGGVPDAHAGSHKLNGSDPVGTNTPTANAIPVADSSGRLDTWVSDASTSVKGKVRLAGHGESTAGEAMQSDDPRGADARTPTDHASSHIGGTDPIEPATESTDGLMSSDDKALLDSIPVANIPTAEQKAALAGSYGTPSAVNRFITESDPVLSSIGGGGSGTGADLLGIGEIGTGLFVDLTTNPALAALNSTDVAFMELWYAELRTYRFNGSTWSQVGTGLSISGAVNPALAALNSTDIAFVDITNKELRCYTFNGTNWSQKGNGLTIIDSNSGCLAALSSTDVAFIDTFNKQLKTYTFDGTNWTQKGNTLAVPPLYANITAFNSTDIVIADYGGEKLLVFTFDGSDWSQKGNSISIADLSSAFLTALNSTDIAFIDYGNNDKLCVYRFDGSNWSQVGSSITIPIADVASLTALTETDVAFIDAYNDELRTYRFLFGYDSASVNIADDFTVPELATGKSLLIRRLAAYDGNAIVITPPSGATFEGRASLSLYGQYSFVELERISSTVFAIKELSDEYTISPKIKSGGSEAGTAYSTDTAIVKTAKGRCFVYGNIVLSTKPSTAGSVVIELTGAPVARAGVSNSVPNLRLSAVTFTGQFMGYITADSVTINLNQISEAGVVAAVANSALANNSSFIFNIDYPI